jgi:hypothetical protein
MPIQLPKAPFYRRWSVILAGVIGLAVIMAGLGWRGLQQVAAPNTTSTTVAVTTTTVAEPDPATSEPPSSLGPTSKPDDVLWEELDSPASLRRSDGFRAPSVWRIEWSLDCSNFAQHGGGNFKITGDGAFEHIQIEKVAVRANGRKTFRRGGYGHLFVETVCDRWTVRVLTA